MSRHSEKRQQKFKQALAALQDQSPKTRKEAIRRLGDFTDPSLINLLRPLLHDSDWRIRRAAIYSLIRQRNHVITPDIIVMLTDNIPSVRKEAAKGLGRLRDARAISPLINAFEDPKPSVQEVAQQSVLQFSLLAVAPLCKTLPHTDTLLARNAAQTLCAIVHLPLQGNYPLSALYSSPVPRAILSSPDLNPQERWSGLLTLHLMDTTFRLVLLWRTSRSVEHLCQQVLKTKQATPEVERGVREVMDYLTLARPGQREPETEHQTLLRAAQSGELHSQVASLLRPSNKEDEEDNEMTTPSLLQRFRQLFRARQ